jgi:hypothetical protein
MAWWTDYLRDWNGALEVLFEVATRYRRASGVTLPPDKLFGTRLFLTISSPSCDKLYPQIDENAL